MLCLTVVHVRFAAPLPIVCCGSRTRHACRPYPVFSVLLPWSFSHTAAQCFIPVSRRLLFPPLLYIHVCESAPMRSMVQLAGHPSHAVNHASAARCAWCSSSSSPASLFPLVLASTFLHRLRLCPHHLLRASLLYLLLLMFCACLAHSSHSVERICAVQAFPGRTSCAPSFEAHLVALSFAYTVFSQAQCSLSWHLPW